MKSGLFFSTIAILLLTAHTATANDCGWNKFYENGYKPRHSLLLLAQPGDNPMHTKAMIQREYLSSKDSLTELEEVELGVLKKRPILRWAALAKKKYQNRITEAEKAELEVFENGGSKELAAMVHNRELGTASLEELIRIEALQKSKEDIGYANLKVRAETGKAMSNCEKLELSYIEQSLNSSKVSFRN